MCGIAGHMGRALIPDARVQSCLHEMRRRGPDHAAHKRWTLPDQKHIDFLHTRLNIIDIDPRSNQPFHVGSRWMIFNGELYNYLELREDLIAKGRRFVTESDTEVLLHVIDHYGWSGLDRCEGMWAFALFDEADNSLVLCRDRFGEKPLYLARDSGQLYFASEIKFIRELMGRPLTPNTDQLFRFLINGYKSLYKKAETFFKEVVVLEPGAFLRTDAKGHETLQRYWSARYQPDDSMTRADAVKGVRDRLIQSVKLRLRADVPLAFCMSGGVDSNSLISIAKNVFHYDVHGFTIGCDDPRYDEHAVVEASVKKLQIRHTSVPVNTNGGLNQLRTLVQYHDAPVYTITYFIQWQLMEIISKNKYRISISGTGADEMFTGYFDHHLEYLHDIRNDPELLGASRRAWTEHIRPVVRNPFLQNPDAFMDNAHMRDHIYMKTDYFNEFLLRPWNEAFAEEAFTDQLLRNRMLNEMFFEIVPPILHEDDLNAMYFSIENRSPFLDRSLFEFCNRIPTRHLIHDGFAKSILRDAMRGIAPDVVLDKRQKVGFNAPVFSVLDVHDPQTRRWLTDESPIFNYMRREKVAELIERPDLPNSESKFLFSFAACKLFLEGLTV